jgi:hypothetical protein
MKNYRELTGSLRGNRSVPGLLAALLLVAIPQAGFAAGPPAFTFKDRCVPYEVEHSFMRANGVDPTKILTTFSGPEDPTGSGANPNAPWVEDKVGGVPVPCDTFHTAKRRTRYEGCHFYDGTPCFFTTNGQLDQNAFTNDEAGRRAFDIAEHFVIYEVVQNLVTGPGGPAPGPPPPPYTPAPIFTDPFAGGFAVGTQTKIMNAANTYWEDDPLGLWKIGFIQFTTSALVCAGVVPPAGPPPDPANCAYLSGLKAQNGVNSQQREMPLIYTGDEIFELSRRGLVSIRYRLGADGTPGGAEGPRYILCPVHRDPSQGSLAAGQDIIQAYPTHIEFQPPSALVILPTFPPSRGHTRFSPAYPFGPTPPVGAGPFAEIKVYEAFDCLQRTGQFCP